MNKKIISLANDIISKLRFINSYTSIPDIDNNEDCKIMIKYNDNISLNDINLILPTQKNDKDEEDCSICIEKININDDIRKLNCGHIFHKNCIDQWLVISPICPICRYYFANTQNLLTSYIRNNPH